MTRVVLIRPGSTDYEAQNRIQGTLDIPLNARGQQEAAETAESLRPVGLDRVFSCPNESACETARLISKRLGIRYRKLDKLHNLNQGLWQGLQEEEVRRKHPRVYRQWCDEPTTVCPPGGEMILEAFDRATQILRPLLRRHANRTIGLVVPEPLASVIRCYLLGLAPSEVWKTHGPDGRWQVVEIGGNAPPATATGQESQ